LRTGLVAYYPFELGSPNDNSGNGLNGIKRSGVSITSDRFENPSSAYHFDGSASSYVEVLQGNAFNFVRDFSLSFWIKSSSSQVTYATIIDKSRQSATTDFAGFQMLRDTSSAEAYLFIVIPSVNTASVSSVFSIVNYQWTHLVLSKDSSQLYVYLNGIATASSPMSIASNILTNGNLPLLIGAANFGQTNPATSVVRNFVGDLDDIFIFNRSVSAAEVKLLYEFDSLPTSQPTRQPSSQPSSQPSFQPIVFIDSSTSSSLKQGLVAYYPFDGGSTNDKSGNGNNGINRGNVKSVSNRFGNPQSAMKFNGFSNFIEINNGNQFNFIIDFSVSFWMVVVCLFLLLYFFRFFRFFAYWSGCLLPI
jgi:hypothetical protein